MKKTVLAVGVLAILPFITIYQKDPFPSPGDWVCWVNPSPKALKKCQPKCQGTGVYAWSKSKEVALKMGMDLCNKNFKTKDCVLDYCEKHKKEK